MHRRHFVATAAAATAAGVAVRAATTFPQTSSAAKLPFIKPRRLADGDSVALVAPASATFNTMELDIATESLQALGLKDHIKPLKVPAWRGAMIGHRMPQFTLGLGLEVEIDATACRIRMLQPGVS
jgi:muramoyltetrapeptide carboxypeptidase LdcA involved in peptidoglycan recycling